MLESAFDPDGLIAFVRELPDGSLVARELPGRDLPPRLFFAHATEVILRHGGADRGFFAALRSVRPQRGDEIESLALGFGVTLPQPTKSSAGPRIQGLTYPGVYSVITTAMDTLGLGIWGAVILGAGRSAAAVLMAILAYQAACNLGIGLVSLAREATHKSIALRMGWMALYLLLTLHACWPATDDLAIGECRDPELTRPRVGIRRC